MYQFLLILLAFPVIAGGREQKTYTISGKMFDYRLYITKDLSEAGAYYEASVDSILVLDKNTHDPIQSIVCEENSYDCIPDDAPRFYPEDMNFDGYEDFRLIEFLTAGMSPPYFYWLYNPNTMKFEQNSSLEDIMAPEFDKVNKCVVSNWRTGSSIKGKTTYKYNKSVLEATEETIEENVNGFVFVTIKKLVDGELKVISKNEITDENE